ncbi:MAG: sulfotransferase family 2 domain-containing protein [Planctomycetota bacterium]|jgi:hypothetical protein
MLKSDSRRFIFVHIQKTGGSSVKQAIRRHVPDARRFLGTHDGAGPGQQELGRRWNKYFSFAVVRNPWDRLVSWYSMISQVDFERRPKHRKNRFWRYVRENSSSFEEFLVNCTDVIEDFDGRKSILFNQFDYVSDDRGRLLVSFVGRFENLVADASHIFERIGMEGIELPHRTRSKHRHYRDYYTPATRDLVGERFQRDIEHFGYRVEEEGVATAGPSATPAAHGS